MFEKILIINYLFDFYGKLLSEKQYLVIELYYLHDLSLSEIGEQLDVSRQGVFDILKRAENKLYDYEDKLGLVNKFNVNNLKAKKIVKLVKDIKTDINNSKFNEVLVTIIDIEDTALEILGNNQEVNI